MVVAWLYVPFGIMIILLACFEVDSLIGLSSVSFPTSVACMIILFFALICCELLLGDRKTRRVIHVRDSSTIKHMPSIRDRLMGIQGGFALQHINILFSPSFVLPLN